jgi:hypothetical protein
LLLAFFKYEEACLLAALHGLHPHFGINEFVVPLFLNDKLLPAENFMKEADVGQKIALVKWLDDLSVDNANKLAALRKTYSLKDAKCSKLSGKSLKVCA